MTSGTSFSAAYVSGLVALMLERNPALRPDQVRVVLMRTARDLGNPGRDDDFGAGAADAFAAVLGRHRRTGDAGGWGFGGRRRQDRGTETVPPTRALNHPGRNVPRMNRPQAQRAARNKFSIDEILAEAKKMAQRFERSPTLPRLLNMGAVFLPNEAVFGASAHPPQAPIWLDPYGLYPGRVFVSAGGTAGSQQIGCRTPQLRHARLRLDGA